MKRNKPEYTEETRDNVRIQMRYYDRTPVEDTCQRLQVTVGKLSIEIIALPGDAGVYIRMDEPAFGHDLAVKPYAGNAIKLVPVPR